MKLNCYNCDCNLYMYFQLQNWIHALQRFQNFLEWIGGPKEFLVLINI